MTFRDLIADTIQTLLAHKMRAGLTMFGLMWGVVSITLMTAAGAKIPDITIGPRLIGMLKDLGWAATPVKR